MEAIDADDVIDPSLAEPPPGVVIDDETTSDSAISFTEEERARLAAAAVAAVAEVAEPDDADDRPVPTAAPIGRHRAGGPPRVGEQVHVVADSPMINRMAGAGLDVGMLATGDVYPAVVADVASAPADAVTWVAHLVVFVPGVGAVAQSGIPSVEGDASEITNDHGGRWFRPEQGDRP